MCLAIPGKVSKIEGKRVWVQYPLEVREVLAGDEKVKLGDSVLVQMGIIIKILSEGEAKAAHDAWKNLV